MFALLATCLVLAWPHSCSGVKLYGTSTKLWTSGSSLDGIRAAVVNQTQLEGLKVTALHDPSFEAAIRTGLRPDEKCRKELADMEWWIHTQMYSRCLEKDGSLAAKCLDENGWFEHDASREDACRTKWNECTNGLRYANVTSDERVELMSYYCRLYNGQWCSSQTSASPLCVARTCDVRNQTNTDSFACEPCEYGQTSGCGQTTRESGNMPVALGWAWLLALVLAWVYVPIVSQKVLKANM